MATTWVSGLTLRWTSIMTWTRRRGEMLDWLEANTEPVAFLDADENFGVAYEALDLRVYVRREGLDIESGVSGLPVRPALSEALGGIFGTLSPSDVSLERIQAVLTQDLSLDDYRGATRALAERALRLGDDTSGWLPTDTSMLTDLELGTRKLQVEYGIVHPKELVERLAGVHAGRVTTGLDAVSGRSLESRMGAVAPVLLFLQGVATIREPLPDPKDLWREYDATLATLDRLTGRIARSTQEGS